MVFLNVYYRIKILKHYRVLRVNRVEFERAHIFNREKLETEVIPRYPQYAEHLYGFSKYLGYTLRMTSVLLVLITLFGAVLMFYR